MEALDRRRTVIALGAAYAAPYLGRMQSAGLDGLDQIVAMQQMIDRLDSSTRLLVASIRRLSDLTTLARQGCDTFTLLPDLLEELDAMGIVEVSTLPVGEPPPIPD